MIKLFKILPWYGLVWVLIGFIIGAATGVATTSYLWVVAGMVFVVAAYFVIDKIAYDINKKS